MTQELSIILPAKNEANSLQKLLPELRDKVPDAEVLVVNDGSTDNTEGVCEANGVKVVSHRQSKGNGGAVKAGARAATGRVFIFMDADGQHRPDDIPRLLELLESGHDMAIGARTRGSQASIGRGVANAFYNWFATRMTGRISRRYREQIQGIPLPAAKRFLLPDHHYHGIFSCRLLG
jgi:glycosyltransferase involved in cell wall biosynthesis